MQLTISMPDGSTASVEVLPSDTVKSLKIKLQEASKLQPNKQKLKVPGHGFLKDAQRLSDYGLAPGSAISLEAKTRGGR